MQDVELHAVLRDTVQPRPEIAQYWRWIVAVVAAAIVVAAFMLPAAMLIAVAVGCIAALLIRFTYCYAKARTG